MRIGRLQAGRISPIKKAAGSPPLLRAIAQDSCLNTHICVV